MKAKDFLQQVASAEKRMQKAQQKVDLYRSLAEKVHASMDGERVSKTRNVTAHEEHMIRLIEAKEQLAAACSAYKAVVEKVTELLCQLEPDEYGYLLSMRYIERKGMTEIAKVLHLSRARAYVHLEEALTALALLLEKNETVRDTARHCETQQDSFNVL